MLISKLCRGHGLNHVTRVNGMVVAVVRDKAAVLFIRGEKSDFAFCRHNEVLFSIAINDDLVRRKELIPFVECKGSRLFLLVNNIWAGTGGDANGARRQGYFRFVSRSFKDQ